MIVNIVRKMPDPIKAIEYFAGEQAFIDEMEKKVVISAVTDPLMKNAFNRYNPAAPAAEAIPEEADLY